MTTQNDLRPFVFADRDLPRLYRPYATAQAELHRRLRDRVIRRPELRAAPGEGGRSRMRGCRTRRELRLARRSTEVGPDVATVEKPEHGLRRCVAANYLALVHLASGLIAFQQARRR